jgi:hypothetical protein
MTNENLSVADALVLAEMIDENMASFEQTAPQTVAALGGRDGLARMCEPTCVGPIPRLDHDTWAAMSEEYEAGRQHGSTNRGQ